MKERKIAALDIAGKMHDVFLSGKWSRLKNTAQECDRWLKSLDPETIIAMEATGGHGLMLAEMAARLGFTVFVLSPRQVSHYRQSLGRRVKSDKADAQLIHDHVAANLQHLRKFVVWEEPWKSLRALVRERDTLMSHAASMRQSLRARGRSKEEIAAVLCSVKAYCEELERQIASQLKKLPRGKDILAIPGVGPIIAGGSLAALGQIPFASKDAFVAWTGNDLVVDDSGTRKGKRRISSWGDKTLRRCYFNGARSAIRTPFWKEYYQAQLDKGFTKTQAICILARKLQRKVYGVYHSPNSS